MTDCSCCLTTDDASSPVWVLDGMFLVFIYGSIVCLWGLGEVCDRFFVPSLKILCEELKIPDNVAGATFMAGGASSPELFVSFLGLFVSKSSIGIGTIIGSEIFNHMCISAGSVFWAEGGVLKLDPKILTREVLAYLSGLIVLIWVLEGDNFGVKTIFDKNSWSTHCLSITWYNAVVLVACYGMYAVIAGNFSKICRAICGSEPAIKPADALDEIREPDSYKFAPEQIEKFSAPSRPSDIGAQSSSSQSFQSASGKSNSVVLSVALHLSNKFDQSGKRDIYGVRVPASSMSIRSSMRKSESFLNLVKNDHEFNKTGSEHDLTENEHGNLLDVPEGSIWICLHYVVLPLKYMLYYTTPDILELTARPRYPYTITACVIWLALLAECLLVCLQYLGNLMHVSPAVMGLTFSAIGTSLPNIWSSMIVARQGAGDMAIAAALGANTFNIYLGLGIPYLVYTLVNGKPYDSLKDDGIVLLILVLLVILVVWYAAIVLSGWEIRAWMGYVYIATYFAVIAYCIAEI